MTKRSQDILLYRSLFETSDEAQILLNGSLKIIDTNKAFSLMFGYGNDECIDKNLKELIATKSHKDYEKFINNPETINYESYISLFGLDKSNLPMPINFGIHKLKFKKDNYFLATFAEIEETQVLGATFSRSQSNLNYESSLGKIGSWSWDLVSGDRSWSDEFYRICGLEPGDKRLNAETVENFIHPEDLNDALSAVGKAIEKRSDYFYKKRLITPNGKVKHVIARGTVNYDKRGKPIFMDGTLQDISQSTNIIDNLQAERDELQKYLDTSASIFLVIAKNHTIKLINRKGYEILGYDKESILGKNWFTHFIPRNIREQLISLFDDILEGKLDPPDVYENWVLTKNNKRKCIRWRNSVLKDDSGNNIALLSSGVDITHEIEVGQKLKKSIEINDAILNAWPDIMSIHDILGTLIDLHVPDPKYLQEPKENFIGKNLTDLLPSDLADNIKNKFRDVIRSKKIATMEIASPLADGNIDYECRFVPMNDDRILTIARDITDKKDAQKLLNIQYRALEAAANGIVIVDAQKSNAPIIYSNAAFTRMTGYEQIEVLGLNCNFLQNDDRDQEAIAVMAAAISKGEACHVVLRNYRKNGEMFWNEIRITPIYANEQQLTHFIGIQNDVTEALLNKKEVESYAYKLELQVNERTNELQQTIQKLVESNLKLEGQIKSTKIAEQNLRSSQAMVSAIIKNFPKGIILVFNSDYELVFVEGEVLKDENLLKRDFKGIAIEDAPFIPKERLAMIKLYVHRTLNGEHLSYETNYKGIDFIVNTTQISADKDNSKVLALFVYNNITEKKKTEEKLKAAVRAEKELNVLKSNFISMASHEFRTPLSAILSSAILIDKQNEPGKEAVRQKHINRIRANVKNLVVILDDFLSLSKLEEGKIIARPHDFDLIEFLRKQIKGIQNEDVICQKISLISDVDSCLIYLDPKLMGHVVSNLLSNAIKYSSIDSKIEVIVKTQENKLQIYFVDHGIGIPLQEQEHLFDRFYRAGNAINFQGTGLGLHIVQRYTELMGGKVSFNSKLNMGSTFIVEFENF